MKSFLFVFIGSCALLWQQSACAGLILEVNTTDKTFALTGSDFGVPFPANSGSTLFGFMYWEAEIPGGSGFDFGGVEYDNDLAWSTTSGTPGAIIGFDTQLIIDGANLSLGLFGSSQSDQTITGSGVFQSYAGLGVNEIASFESMIGSELIKGSFITGFSNIQIQAASTSGPAVPEPASWLLMAISTAGLAARRRWKRKA